VGGIAIRIAAWAALRRHFSAVAVHDSSDACFWVHCVAEHRCVLLHPCWATGRCSCARLSSLVLQSIAKEPVQVMLALP